MQITTGSTPPEAQREIDQVPEISHRARTPTFCFEMSTPVYIDTHRGYTEIGELGKGSMALSRCEATGAIAYKEVLSFFETEGDIEVWGVEYRRSTEGFQPHGYVRATPDHPFWVEGYGWKAVRDLQIGDLLLTHDGKRMPVTSVAYSGYAHEVYNLEVADFNTYFVGYEGVWVRG